MEILLSRRPPHLYKGIRGTGKCNRTPLGEMAMTGNGNDLEDLPGVGPTTADKLKEAGYTTIEIIATASAAELAEVAEISDAVAKKLVKAAKDRTVVSSFRTGADIMEQRKNVKKLKTFVPELDA